MTKSATRIQDKDSQKRLSVVRSTEDPTKYGVVILNPDGSKIRGPKGEAATVSVGTTTTGQPGTSASVTNSGTTSDAVLNFTIPAGVQGETGQSATITVGSTTTGEAGTSASVTNSGTTSAAVLDFVIPKGDTGQQGPAATIAVGTTSTGAAGSSASVTNSGTSSAAVFNFTIPKGDTGSTGDTGNGIESVTSSKSGKVTTVTMDFTDPNMSDFSFTVSDGNDGEGAGDVLGPSSSTDGDIVLFDGATGKIIKDSSKSLSDYQTTISDLGDIRTGAGLGATAVQPGDLGTAASCNTGTSSGNVPILDSNGKLNTSTLPGVALTDTFTVSTASDLTGLSSAEQGDIAIVTTESKTYVLSAAPYSTAANWKELLSPTDSVTSVNSKTGAVTLNADDISDSTTTNKFVTASDITTWNNKQNALSTQTAYTSKGSATKVPQITTNTLGQVTGITEVTITHPSQVSDTAYASSWDGVTDTAPSKNAVYDKINAMDTTISGKQDALSTQTAYTSKGTSTKVPTITTNTLGQVTGITETSIAFPVSSVNGSTGAVTVSEFNPGGTATTGYVLKKTANGYGWDAESGAVTSVNGQTGAVTVSEFTPTSSGSTDQVLTKTAGGYDWATPSSSTTTTATLTSAGWSSKEQTVSVTGVTASNTIIVSPAPANINDYALCSIYCSAQGSGTLTFKCNTVPSDAITVNVLILN